jgi:hypothetical protein
VGSATSGPLDGTGPLSRRGFLRVSLQAAVASAGAYALIEELAKESGRSSGMRLALSRAQQTLPFEQYLLSDTQTITDNGVVVTVPPLYHQVVTATLATEATTSALQAAQKSLETVLGDLESDGLLDYTPAGLGLSVGWGLSYFQLPVMASVASAYLPLDHTAPPVGPNNQSVLLPSTRFGTDPPTVILEDNDVVFVMVSDSLANIATANSAIFDGDVGDLFTVTSIRKGFVDATQLSGGGVSVTKQFALANKLPGADSIPDQAELFLGFTSTQEASVGPTTIANFESLGMTNQTKGSYFTYGTILALSHLYEDLVLWYGSSTYSQRVAAAFRPGIAANTPEDTLTVAESKGNLETPQQIVRDAGQFGVVGHSASMQPVSRLAKATHGFAKGTAIPVRADFNTVDNPFFYSSDPSRDGWSSSPSAGLHFLSYVPTSFYFQTLRQAMDSPRPSGPPAPPWEAFVKAAGIRTTHRQNFLIPPRLHRSFPLAELL